MSIGWKYGKPIKEKLMTLEEPGKPLPFDADKGLIGDITARFNIGEIARNLQGKDEKEAYRALEELGREVMELTIELADGKYLDRTGEMVERVAQLTGISFPHRLQRYVELFILGLRPTDRWNITKSTTKELVLQVTTCSVQKALEEVGIKGLPCRGFCFAGFDAAAKKSGDNIKTEMPMTLPADGKCEFRISV